MSAPKKLMLPQALCLGNAMENRWLSSSESPADIGQANIHAAWKHLHSWPMAWSIHTKQTHFERLICSLTPAE